ncbi:MAG: phage holin family protein [Candidatus Gracilibacteria bacterium]|nr:phage holin family protein [Candidatus Gracilibacteria bacterium]
MKILISILFNALILYLLTYLLGANPSGTVQAGINVTGEPQVYIIGGLILGLINVTIKPILKILAIPLFFVFLGLVSFLINGVVLLLLDYIINDILIIKDVSYSIAGQGLDWWINFIIAVAIFTILNMFYSLLISKK